MTVNVSVKDSVLSAKVTGRLDSGTSSDFEASVRGELTEDLTSIELDFTEVDFISSKALRVLVSLYNSIKTKNLVILNPNESVMEVLKLSGLLKAFRTETR